MLKGLFVLILAAVSFFLYGKFGSSDSVEAEATTTKQPEEKVEKEVVKQEIVDVKVAPKQDLMQEKVVAKKIIKKELPKQKTKTEIAIDPTAKLKPVKNISYYDNATKRVKKVQKIPKNALVIKLPEVPKVEAVVPVVVTVGGTALTPRAEGRNKYNRSISTPVSAPPKKEIQALIKKAKEHNNAANSVVSTTAVVADKVETSDKKETSVAISHAGESSHGRLSTYLRSALMDEKDVTKKLKDAGFKILATIKVNDNPNLTSIVFSSDELEKYADKKDRGYISTLRVLIDKEHKQTTISNPLYFAKAFMQDDYSSDVPKQILKKLQTIFVDSKSSKDLLKDSLLPKYHFMMGMPYFEDMEDVAKASSSEALLKKIQAYKNGARVKYVQKLSANRIVVGVVFSKATNAFIKKIGTQNALLMPYPLLLENGVAKMLNPKYYLAVSYPMLKMSQFMAIASVPDAMIDECEVMFK